MVTLETAVKDLREVGRADLGAAPDWRRRVRGRLAAVRDALAETASEHDDWLAPRSGTAERERHQLDARVAALAARVRERLEVEVVAVEVARLQRDLEHHLQRRHDLAYDAVGMEIGGSE